MYKRATGLSLTDSGSRKTPGTGSQILQTRSGKSHGTLGEHFCGFQQKRSRCSACSINRLVRIKTNQSWMKSPVFPRKKPVCALFSVFADTAPHPQTGAKTGVCGGSVRPRQAEERSGQYCHKRKTDEIKVVFLTSPNFSATLPKSVRESHWQ